MSNFVLDASAILALIHLEVGHDTVAAVIPFACVSSVNASEVIAKLAEGGTSESEIIEIFKTLNIPSVPFGQEQSRIAGLLRPKTKRQGLSFGDRACLSLGIQRQLTVLTADKAWANLSLGVEIQIIR